MGGWIDWSVGWVGGGVEWSVCWEIGLGAVLEVELWDTEDEMVLPRVVSNQRSL